MKRWLPIILGLGIGGAVGVYFLFVPVECVPALIRDSVWWMAGSLRRVFLPNQDPMAALVLEIPLLVLHFAVIGGVLGLMVSLVFRRFRCGKRTDP